MSCDCAQFPAIELDRQSITRRIKQSPAIRARLTEIAEHTELGLYLFICPECGQLWQSGPAWNFAGREYLFHVPPIEFKDWQSVPYQQPAEMMIYSTIMREFFDRCTFEKRDAPCRVEGCRESAVQLSVFCCNHHIESLQQRKQLPQNPVGRMFPPYHVESPEVI